ncbi:mitochondrial inner membrane magnesium transporter Mfm1p [Trichomonascus vanleenenianus]|uniref:CorA family magnesium transporter n=1 Tax=Trichomonascus vanleenenianus TaxID=2268995 RepID=UPI003ECB8F0C
MAHIARPIFSVLRKPPLAPLAPTFRRFSSGVGGRWQKSEQPKLLSDRLRLTNSSTPLLGAADGTTASSPAAFKSLNDLILQKSLSHRSIGDHLVRCTVFDLHGNVKVVSGEFKRSELLSKHGLLPRDLRKLDIGTSSIVPSILVRTNSILVNLLHIRALIKADMVLLFDAYGSTDSKTQSVFMYDLEHKLRYGTKTMGGLPYEMRALEAIFISVVTALDAEMQVHTTVINGILAELEDDIDREKLRLLLIQSKKLSSFYQKATLIRDAIEELLDQDEDLAGIYLTEKLKGTPRDEDADHGEIEMLLESYYKHCDEIVQTVGNLINNIRSTEEIINIILDSNRNSLMLLDLKFQIGTLGLGGGAFIASLYGMNLMNFIEETNWGFLLVSGVVTVFSIGIVIYALRNLQRVQRITMMIQRNRKNKRKK